MPYYIIISLFSLFAFAFGVTTAQGQQTKIFRIAELNCENLFDTVHDEGFNDYEYLPASAHQWDSQHYRSKLNNIAREIVSIAQTEPLDIIVLTEIENDSVIRDLTQRTRLSALRYQSITTHSHDPRGIDIALLYQQGGFRPLHHASIDWDTRLKTTYNTRDMIHVNGIARSGDTIDILALHMPSRLGGIESQNKRMRIAREIRRYADSIMQSRPNANIIIIGDLNDTPKSKSIRKGLGAKILGHDTPYHDQGIDKHGLYNISDDIRGDNGARATYRYKGHWEMLDQCIINGGMLLPDAHLRINNRALKIIDHPFLLEQDQVYGNQKPWRTYQGPWYKGGFSDHLPILLELEF